MSKKVCGSCFAILAVSLTTVPPATYASGRVVLSQAVAPATAAAVARQIGTVKTVAGSSLTLATDAGQQVSITVAAGATILQLAPGSTNLKDAQAIALNDIEVGDRVLVTGKAGADANSFEASRVVLMKSSDIAQKHATEEADWQKRGVGGIVSAVADGNVTITEGAKKIAVNASSKTQFRRYAGDSVKFEDAKLGSFAQIQVGDQLRARGEKSVDGSSIDAEEVVTGSFKNLAGTIATIDASDSTLTLKDLATKKIMKVKITPNSSVRALPPQAATMFAARAKDGAGNVPHGSQAPRGEGQASGSWSSRGSDQDMAQGQRQAGFDLSQMVSRLPDVPFTDLKVGDAVMIVASQSDPASQTETAVTLLSGVGPILAAAPSGSPSMTLSPWSMGGAGAESSGPQ